MGGIGSGLFHATLQWRMQLLDELPMIYLTLLLAWHCIETEHTKNGTWLAMLLGLVAVVFTWTYVTVWHHPLYFITVFSVLVMYLAYKTHSIQISLVQGREKQQWQSMQYTAIVVYAMASLFWIGDTLLCMYLRTWRHEMEVQGLGWISPVLEYHAWWHVLSGYATYVFIVSCAYVRLYTLELIAVTNTMEQETPRQDTYQLVWIRGVFPSLVPSSSRSKHHAL